MLHYFRALAVSAAVVLGVGDASSQEATPGIVVELYTSQGCSSCPPADELLAQLKAREDVIPLALHVDYWDYIGWKDLFAQPEFTRRQRSYAAQAGKRMIYTPQMVIGGVDHVIGTRPMELSDAIQRQRELGAQVNMSVLREDGEAIIRADVPGGAVGPLTVQLVIYLPSQSVDIKRGENRGRTITYSNIVVSWENVGTWSTTEALDMRVPVPDDVPMAVILQQPNSGPILAAAQIR